LPSTTGHKSRFLTAFPLSARRICNRRVQVSLPSGKLILVVLEEKWRRILGAIKITLHLCIGYGIAGLAYEYVLIYQYRTPVPPMSAFSPFSLDFERLAFFTAAGAFGAYLGVCGVRRPVLIAVMSYAACVAAALITLSCFHINILRKPSMAAFEVLNFLVLPLGVIGISAWLTCLARVFATRYIHCRNAKP